MRHFAYSLLLFSACALASPENYPFQIRAQPDESRHAVIAENDGPAPIFVTLKLIGMKNARSDHESPMAAVVMPGQTLRLASVRAIDPRQNFSFSTSTSFAIGDPAALPDPQTWYRLPFLEGQTALVSQAPGGRITTHTTADSQYAIDFNVPIGTPVAAARAGKVVDLEMGYRYGGPDPALADKSNYVLILHRDGSMALYAHLHPGKPLVSPGQWVEAGELIGYSGNTGYSSGPHLHFALWTTVQFPDGSLGQISHPVKFNSVQLSQGQQVIAGRNPDRQYAQISPTQPAFSEPQSGR